ncbi:MAG: ATP-binding cassette domain-containing protein [Eubacteriales bacterium]|nr:ATP-binding cassette domain-containing protein [Eubacteriales bacterium]
MEPGKAPNDLDRPRRNELVRQMIQMVRLDNLADRYPAELSGGQQQRVALARALAVEPQALLLDEPFSALDENLRIEMTRQLLELLANYHGATVFVTHNMEEAYRICQQMVMVVNGKVEFQGEKTQLFQTPPSRAVAQLTGCKNFSAAVPNPAGGLTASGWGVNLVTNCKSLATIQHIGIRAHDIRLATEPDRLSIKAFERAADWIYCQGSERSAEQVNVFAAWPSFTSETPFRMTIFLALGKQPAEIGDYHLQWEVSKEQWQALQNLPLPWQICLNPDQLILLDR